MKKYIICLWLLSSVLVNVYAQKLVVKDICELTSDITARTKVKLDKNGKECALVRVNIPSIRNVDFTGDIVNSDYFPGEYVLYVPEGTKSIAYSFDSFSGQIDFPLFGIDVRGKCSYRCTMKKESDSPQCKLTIHSEPESAIVVIDGIPKGETPLLLDDLSVGEHVISIPNTNGYTLPDKNIQVKKGDNQDLFLKLVKSPLDFQDPNYSGYSENDLWHKYNYKKENNKVGIVDLWGNVVVPCQFDNVSREMRNGFFIIWEGRNCGLYEPGKGVVVQPQYNGISGNYSETIIEPFLRVSKRINGFEKYGYIDCKTGKEVVSCQLHYASEFPIENCLIVATRYDSYGYLKIEDGKMKVFIEPQLDMASNFENGIALVRLKKQMGDVEAIIDSRGHIIKELPPYYSHSYNFVIGFSDGLCSIRKNGKTGFIDKEGKEVIPCLYGEAESTIWEGRNVDFWEGGVVMDAISPNGQKGRILLSKTGKVIGNQDNIEFIGTQKNYVFKNNGKEGVISRNGEVIVPCEFEKCKILRDGWVGNYTDYSVAYKGGICDLYDCHGQKLFSCPEGLDIVACKDGFIMVQDSEAKTYGYANLSGDIIASCIYNLSERMKYMMNYKFAPISDGLAMLVLGEKYGFIDNTGKIVVPVNYTAAIPFENGIGYVRDGNKWIRIQKDKLLQ